MINTKDVIEISKSVMDFVAGVIPISFTRQLNWNPENEDPIVYGFYLFGGTVVLSIVAGFVLLVCTLVVVIVFVAWKVIIPIILSLVAFLILGKLRLRNCTKKSVGSS